MFEDQGAISKAFLPGHLQFFFIGVFVILASVFPALIFGFVVFPIHMTIGIAAIITGFVLHGICRGVVIFTLDIREYLIKIYEACKVFFGVSNYSNF